MRARGTTLAVVALLALAACGAGGDPEAAPSSADAGTTAAAGGSGTAPDEDAVVRVHLVRHGETIQNVKNLAAGWSDAPLTPVGEEVATSAGDGLAGTPFVAAWSSDLQRTQQTARAILAEHPAAPELRTDEDLREWGFGGFESDPIQDVFDPLLAPSGLSAVDLHHDLPGVLTALGDGSIGVLADAVAAADPAGLAESDADIEARITDALDRIVADARSLGGGDVLVVSHGMTMLSLLDVMGIEGVEPALPSNVSRSVAVLEDGVWSLELLNDTSHLTDATA